jgi:hypothetical protein
MIEPPHRVSFKFDSGTFVERLERDGVIPAPYLARAKWVSMESLGHGMDWQELEGRVRRSYALGKGGLRERRSLRRNRPGPFPGTEGTPTNDERKVLPLQFEQDADLLLERQACLRPMPLCLSLKQAADGRVAIGLLRLSRHRVFHVEARAG